MIRTVGNGRKEHPATRGVESGIIPERNIIRFGFVKSPESFGGVEIQGRKVIVALIGQEQRMIIRNFFADKRENKRGGKNEKKRTMRVSSRGIGESVPWRYQRAWFR